MTLSTSNCPVCDSSDIQVSFESISRADESERSNFSFCTNCKLTFNTAFELESACPLDSFRIHKYIELGKTASEIVSIKEKLESCLSYAKGPELSILSLADPEVLEVFQKVRTHDLESFYLTDFQNPDHKNILNYTDNEPTDKTQFDFIWADQLISRVENPDEWFAKMHELLSPAGILWIRTIYLENFKRSLTQKKRILKTPPYRYFSSMTLEYLAKENGLEFVDTTLEQLDTKTLLDTVSENMQTGLLKPVTRYLVLLRSKKNIMNVILHKPDLPRKIKLVKRSKKKRYKRSA